MDIIASLCLIVSLVIVNTHSWPYRKEEELRCGYSSCHPVNKSRLTVHLIPHSHDDVGWLKTVDQYFYGSRSSIQKAGVQYIIESYVDALKDHPDRRFIQVETAFFWKWWLQQDERSKQDYIDLVNRGQIEIINGAWSMNDEAAVNYQSTIDQFTLGLRIINDTLGKCGTPKIGWQIDPFGHSREMASLYTQLGFEGFFLGRLDYADKANRKGKKNMDFLWKGSANLDNTTLFGNVLLDFYLSPSGFCFDIECDDAPIIDDEESPDYNLDQKVQDFKNIMIEWSGYLKTKNILVPMGGDFQYQAADKNFINMDRLMAGFKKMNVTDMDLIYSTPSCYMKAVNEESLRNNVNFTVKTDDFFPYASDQHSYWGGYFTSRPTSKRLERVAHNILQAAKQLATFASLRNINYGDNLISLKKAMGIMQHHDAITGTEKQHVAQDYARIVARGINRAEKKVGAVVRNLLDNSTLELNDLKTCLLTNMTVCETSQWDNFSVIVYNPFSHSVNYTVILPVAPIGNYSVRGPKGIVNFLLLPSIIDFSYVEESIKASGREIRFTAKEIPPFGVQYYYVNKTDNTTKTQVARDIQNIPKDSNGDYKLGTSKVYFLIDYNSNMLKSVTLNNITLPIKQTFHYYESAVGDNYSADKRSSGAYIFRPRGPSIPVTDKAEIVSMQETYEDIRVHQRFGDYISQIIRVNKHDPVFLEFDWIVGPIPVNERDYIGKEIVTKFILPDDFVTNETFYTDSNGREMLKRKVNSRDDYPYNPTFEPIASNYYPITSKITVKDERQQIQVSVLNDRAQGGTHMVENGTGFVELMVHRRILHDDAFGVEEALNEMEYGRRGLTARGQHYLVIGSSDPRYDGSTTAKEKYLAQKILRKPWVLVTNETENIVNNTSNKTLEFSGLNTTLPANVHLLTLEPWKDDLFLLRLEHFFEKAENGTLSQPAKVNLNYLVESRKIAWIRETTLGANQWLDDFNRENRMQWITDQGMLTTISKSVPSVDVFNPVVDLEPMQIRTFIVRFGTAEEKTDDNVKVENRPAFLSQAGTAIRNFFKDIFGE